MGKNYAVQVLLVVAVLIVGVVTIILISNRNNPNDSSSRQQEIISEDLESRLQSLQVGDVFEFTAELTDYDSSCAADAQCAAIFGSTRVITNPGFVMGPIVIGEDESSFEKIGETFDVRAVLEEDGSLSIVGDESLFIKLSK